MYKASDAALSTSNPIRLIVDKIVLPEEDPKKPTIHLSIGDPTKYGNLPIPKHVESKVSEIIAGAKHNGYLPSTGLPEGCQAVADQSNARGAHPKVSARDVLLSSGCSHALSMSMRSLCSSGDNLLVPQPGFSLYTTLCGHFGVEPRYYNLLPDSKWQVDLESLEALIDDKTRGILINNPSNPCGSNYSKEHLADILALAERRNLPIIADEIYADMTFGSPFHAMASIASKVCVLECGGIAKRYMMPGWRLGWVVIHNREGKFDQIADALNRCTTTILGPNSITQALLPSLIKDTPQSYYKSSLDTLRVNAETFILGIKKVPGLSVTTPEGAMYCMVGIDVDAFDDSVSGDVSFSNALLAEARVFVLPGSCFRMDNFFRVVFLPPKDMLQSAVDRIAEFCKAHAKVKE